MRLARVLACFILLALAGCGTSTPSGLASSPDPEQRYEANATVLQSSGQDPELCLGAVAESYPPQCGGPPITNWDWDRADGEESAAGTTWGAYHVVGTFDGTSFTLTEDPRAPRYEEDTEEDPFRNACPTPAGGWPRPDPNKTGDQALSAVSAAADDAPDYAGFWINDPNPPSGEQPQDLSQVVVNVTFTGDPAAHERELRTHWGGALCVAQVEHSHAELQQIADELQSDEDLEMLTSSVNVVYNRVDFDVVWVPAGKQAELDERYGDGVVRLTGALEPLA